MLEVWIYFVSLTNGRQIRGGGAGAGADNNNINKGITEIRSRTLEDSHKIVFTTYEWFGVHDFGGLEGADAACQTEADNTGAYTGALLY